MSRPLPVEALKLRGYSDTTVRKLSSQKSEKVAAFNSGKPETPQHLNAEEREAWTAAVALLEQRGTLTPGDGPALTLYAQTVVEHRAERTHLENEGRVPVVNKLDRLGRQVVIHDVNPRVRVVRDLEKTLVLLLRELGLTPLRRHHVQRTAGGGTLSLEDLLSFPGQPQ